MTAHEGISGADMEDIMSGNELLNRPISFRRRGKGDEASSHSGEGEGG